jgi:hypothetical protein
MNTVLLLRILRKREIHQTIVSDIGNESRTSKRR